MRVYVSVAEEGGFAAAARKLDISPAAVTRAVVGLEEMLGVKLLLRTTRNVRLTEAGKQFFDDSRSILISIAEATETVSGLNKEPQGTLSITAPVLFGRMYVMPCISEYMQRYPKVKVIAHFVDRITSFVEENMDVAIRIGHLPDSSLRAIKVGEVRKVLCASKTYIEENGIPQHPKELVKHSSIGINVISPHMEWQFGQADDQVSVQLNPRLILNSNEAALAAALKGIGIARLLSYQVKSEVDQGLLQLLLEKFEEASLPVHVVHREDKYGSSKVRAFIDHVAESLRDHLHL